jgi:hypothetical protein
MLRPLARCAIKNPNPWRTTQRIRLPAIRELHLLGAQGRRPRLDDTRNSNATRKAPPSSNSPLTRIPHNAFHSTPRRDGLPLIPLFASILKVRLGTGFLLTTISWPYGAGLHSIRNSKNDEPDCPHLSPGHPIWPTTVTPHRAACPHSRSSDI